jgi:Tfp pilus assembly protein PilN
VATLNALDASRAPQQGAGTPEATVLRLLTAHSAEWIVSSPTLLAVIPVTSASPDTLWQDVAASWQALREQGTERSTPVRMIGPPEALPRAQEALAGVPVDRADPIQAVAAEAVTLEHPERAAAALGLALQGLGAASVPLNLLAGAQREERARKIHKLSVIASGVCLVAAFGFGVNGMLEVRARRVSVQRSLDQRERLYQTLRPEVRALIQRQQQTERRNLRLEQLVAEAPALTRLLAQIAEALPREAWLISLECSKAGALEGLLEGHAASFQDVTKFLEQLKGMATVKPLSTSVITDETSGTEAIAFTVQIQQPLQPPSPEGR